MEPTAAKTYNELLAAYDALHWRLEEATDTIHAIRSGQVDALVVQSSDGSGPELYSLKTADQTYRVFIEQMSEGALTLDKAGIILYCNSTFADLLDFPISQVLGSALHEFITDDCKPDFENLFARGWRENVKGDLQLHGAAQTISCQLSLNTLALDDGVALSVIVTDLTFQKEAQRLLKENNARLQKANADLEQSNADLLQFASVASHDLQEPLRKIMVFTDMLKRHIPEESEGDTFVRKIIASSKRMKGLIADILAYSRLAGSHGVQVEQFSLNDLVADILEDYEVLITDKEAVVHVGELPVVNANRSQMRQAFQNLLSNALKFSRAGVAPIIHVDAEPAPGKGFSIISISDNGIGFDERYRERIFALFQRLNTKDHFEGSGIGLAVTRKIIEGYGGSLSATSEEGVGSVFYMTLPVVVPVGIAG